MNSLKNRWKKALAMNQAVNHEYGTRENNLCHNTWEERKYIEN